MDYRIISADATQGQIQVTYSNDGVDHGTFAIDVPIVDGKFLTGSALDDEIQRRAPVWLIERKAMVASAEDFHHILAMVQPPTPVPTEMTMPPAVIPVTEI